MIEVVTGSEMVMTIASIFNNISLHGVGSWHE